MVAAPRPPPLPFLCLVVFVAAARCPFFFCMLCPCLLARRSSAVLAVCPSPPPSLVCFAGLPLLGLLCALAAFVFPASLLAAPWRLLPPPPPPSVSRVFRRCRSLLRFFFFAVLLLPAYLALVSGSRRLLPPCSLLLFVFLVSRWSALRVLSLLLCFPPGRCLLPGGCCPPPPSVSRVFRRCRSLLRFFFLLCCVAPACFLRARRRFSPSAAPPPPPPNPGACVVPPAVWCCRAALPFRRVFCGAVLPCSACSRCGLVYGFGLRCRVLCCAVCPWVRCCAALLRVVPPDVVLLSAVLVCCARWVPLLVVPCPLALPIALGSWALRRCVLRCSPALCALCCVYFVAACSCVLLVAAVLCAVCVLGCRAVGSLSSLLCAVLCFAVLVRLRCAVRVVRAVAGAWCCGGLLCVVLFPLVFCGALLGLVARGCLLVACLGVGDPVGPRGLLPCGWCGLLWCPASLCCALWCCAVAWCCAVVLCCRFAVLFVFALPSCGLSCGAVLSCVVLLVGCGVFSWWWRLCAVVPFPSLPLLALPCCPCFLLL